MEPMRTTLLLVTLSACAGPTPMICNGSTEACALRVDEMLWPRTHNSHSAEELGYLRGASNQLSAIPTQLADGIRSLNVDTYFVDGTLLACHSNCGWGQQPAAEIFAQVDTFLEDNPSEILLLDFQAYGHDEALVDALQASGLNERAATHEPGAAWPTLGSLLDADERIFLFTAQGGQPAWFHHKDDHVTTTDYEYATVEAFDCNLRNEAEGGLFEVAHHLYRPVSLPALAEEAHTRAAILDRIAACEAEVGHPVNAFEVDFYELGAFIEVMAELAP